MNHFEWALLEKEKPAPVKNSWAERCIHGTQNMGIVGTDMKGTTQCC